MYLGHEMGTTDSTGAIAKEKNAVPLCDTGHRDRRLPYCSHVLLGLATPGKRQRRNARDHTQSHRRRLTPPTSETAGPPGLKFDSIVKYKEVWRHYLAFASERRNVVPGRDAPWEAGLLWAY